MIKEKFLKGVGLGFGFLLVLFIFSRLGFFLPLKIESVVTNKNDIFTVYGEEKAVVVPDVAYVNLGIEITSATVSQGQKKINQVNDQLIKALKNLGIDQKDIQTENYNINPQYDWQRDLPRIVGYQVSTNLKVKIKSLDKINQVIDEASRVGVNNIYGVSFAVESEEKYLSRLRQQAAVKAKKKAQEAARITGFRLGKVVNYSETISSPTSQPIYPLGTVKIDQEEKTSIQPGSQEIKITVYLGYEIY